MPDIIDTKIETKHFNGNSLWGYINGGADLYLEYGFDNLTLHIFQYNAEQIKIELYKMTSNETAFGIFSVSFNKCKDFELLTKYYCINNYHVQIARGKYYISIINETGKKETLEYCIEIAKKLIIQIDDEFELPSLLKMSDLINNTNIKLFKGELGLQNINSNISNWLKLNKDLICYFTPLSTDSGEIEMFYVKFKKKSDLSKFLLNNVIKLNENKLLHLADKSIHIFNRKISNLELILLTTNKEINLKSIYDKNFSH
ncbi:MAG: DUF6599 family protein [bacterium]